MKKVVKFSLLYYILFLVSLVSVYGAITANDVYLRVNEVYELGGKKITLINVHPDGSLIVDVDHIQGIVPKRGNINGMYIVTSQVYDYIDYRAAIVNLTVYFQCGDGVCVQGSEPISCCKDCGCFGDNKVCIDNFCQFNDTVKKLCFRNEECPVNANDTCETAKCLNYQCIYERNITCDKLTSFGKCLVDSECNDNNPCTLDKCQDRNCVNTTQEGCILNAQCIGKGYIDNDKYCDGSNFVVRKDSLSSCTDKYECLSNSCIAKRCLPGFKGKSFLTITGLVIVLVGLYFYIRFNYRRTIKI